MKKQQNPLNIMFCCFFIVDPTVVGSFLLYFDTGTQRKDSRALHSLTCPHHLRYMYIMGTAKNVLRVGTHLLKMFCLSATASVPSSTTD